MWGIFATISVIAIFIFLFLLLIFVIEPDLRNIDCIILKQRRPDLRAEDLDLDKLPASATEELTSLEHFHNLLLMFIFLELDGEILVLIDQLDQILEVF